MTREEIEIKYNIICPLLFYNGLISCIPTDWKINILQNIMSLDILLTNAPILEIKMEKEVISIYRVKGRDLYWSNVQTKCLCPISYYKWESEFYYANFDWEIGKVYN